MFNRGDEEGEPYAWAAVDGVNRTLAREACDLLAQHFRTAGRQDNVELVEAERYDVDAADNAALPASVELVAADLTPDDETRLRLALDDPQLAAAYLVQRRPRRQGGRPQFFLCVRSRPRWGPRGRSDEDLVARLIPRVRLPGRVLILAPAGSLRALAKRVMAVPGARWR